MSINEHHNEEISKFKKTDLHMHTKSSFDVEQETSEQQEQYKRQFEYYVNNIHTFAITDHNYFDYVSFKTLEKKYTDNFIIPGFEINAFFSGGDEASFHMLVYLDPDKINKTLFDKLYEKLFSKAYISPSDIITEKNNWSEDGKILTIEGCKYYDYEQLAQNTGSFKVNLYMFIAAFSELGYRDNIIIIVPHYDDKKTVGDKQQDWEDMNALSTGFINAVEYRDLEKGKESFDKFLKTTESSSAISIISSDLHLGQQELSEKEIYDATKFIPFLKHNNSFEGIRLALMENTRFLTAHEHFRKQHIIGRTYLSKATYLTKTQHSKGMLSDELLFSPNLNSIIGAKSSGKSYLLRSIYEKLVSTKEKKVDWATFDLSFSSQNHNRLQKRVKYIEQAWLAKVSKESDPRIRFNELIRYFDMFNTNTKNMGYDLDKYSKNIKSSYRHLFDFETYSDYDNSLLVDNILKYGKSKDLANKTYFIDAMFSHVIGKKIWVFEMFEKNFKEISKNIANLKFSSKEINKYLLSGKEQEFDLTNYIDRDKWDDFYPKIKDIDLPKGILKAEFTSINRQIFERLHTITEQTDIASGYSHRNKLESIRSQLRMAKRIRTILFAVQKIKDDHTTKTFPSDPEEMKLKYIVEIIDNVLSDKASIEKAINGIKGKILYAKDIKIETNWIFRYSNILANFLLSSNTPLSEIFDPFFDSIILTEFKLTRQRLADDGEIKSEEDILSQSPGTIAASILELTFILANEDYFDILLFDQPEDQIDNLTISEDLIDLIKKAKEKCQIIIASHNASIVVNSDSDNVISINKNATWKEAAFKYDYGAFEFKHNNKYRHSSALQYLDGGKINFDRRTKVYNVAFKGKQNE